ncbi:hypothetical protein [Endozoicomonas numazuensis]|uniref:Uncharacterized protein n=1 Tax=Endozoicomonas numazuensis TaxID=1137799 RepID=A0A081NJY7_9GAMM|nr:hypothetical protein [Endozoicomonas numazuensis]KEQ18760.1 hypothetical protein GZ78_01305 [Endozoicomonas numazuensis]
MNFPLVSALLLATSVSFADDLSFQPDTSEALAAQNHVENILIATYERVLAEPTYSESELTNAPISGFGESRGRNLLTFAAFNNFPELALWGLAHSAGINTADRDGATMLRMSLANYNVQMTDIALKNKADPNMVIGQGDDTMLSALLSWQWPEVGFELAKLYGALPRTKKEKNIVRKYLLQRNADNDTLINHFDSLSVIENPLRKPSKGNFIETNMMDEMDADLLRSMTGEFPLLNQVVIDSFSQQGKNFESFLAFNGFSKSLAYRLQNMPFEQAEAVVMQRDSSGNDLLLAAIKSLNSDTVEVVLETTYATINTPVPHKKQYYTPGLRPWHIADLWEAPKEIKKLLIQYGVDKSADHTAAVFLDQFGKKTENKFFSNEIKGK